MSLPFEVSEASVKTPRAMLIYGAPKVGKTSSAIALPNSCVLMLEHGADGHRCAHTPKIDNVFQFMGACDKIIEAGRPYKYLIVDSGTELEQQCRAQAVKDYKATTIGKNFTGTDVCTELDRGSGYNWLRNAYNKCICKAQQAIPEDGCVIYLCHVRESQLSEKGDINGRQEGKDVSAYSIALTAGVALILASRCSAVAHMTRRTRPRPGQLGPVIEDLWLSFKTSDRVVCGSIHDHLAGKEFAFCLADDRRPLWDLVFAPELSANASAATK